MSDLLELAKIKKSEEEWDQLYRDEPEIAEALRYLLLLELHGGSDADNKKKLPMAVTEAIATDMGISVTNLILKRRLWTNSEALMKARDWIAPIRIEADMILADKVMGRWNEIVEKVLEKTLDKENNIYAILAGAQWLKTEVIAPAKAKQRTTDNADVEYVASIKAQELEDEAQRYLDSSEG